MESMKSLIETLGTDLKVLAQDVKKNQEAPAQPKDWNEDPTLPQTWLVERLDGLSKQLTNFTTIIVKKAEANSVEINSLNSVTTNLKKDVDGLISVTDKHTNILADSVDVQKETLDELKKVKEHETICKDKVKPAEVIVEARETAPVEKANEKGVIFSSSIGKGMNKERLESATNSKIQIVPTYHLIKKNNSKDPEAHLLPMVAKHVTDDVDFVAICVGTNDITDMNNDWSDDDEILDNCKKQAKTLVDTAQDIVSKNKDVYLLEQPPRYDPVVKDPKGNWAKYSKLFNSNLALLAAGKDRIHIVENSNLARLPGKGREELYNDGLHLTKKGLYTLETNLLMAIHKMRPDLRALEIHAKTTSVKTAQRPKKTSPGLSGSLESTGSRGQSGLQQRQQQQWWQQQQQDQQQWWQQQQDQQQHRQHQQQQYWAPQQWHSYGHPQYFNNNQYTGW